MVVNLRQIYPRANTNMILVTIRANTHPDKRTEFTQTITSLLDRIRNSAGCLSCRFYQEFGHEDTFCLVEEWASQQEFDSYLRTNSFSVLLGAMQILLNQPAEIKINTISRTDDTQKYIEALLGKPDIDSEKRSENTHATG